MTHTLGLISFEMRPLCRTSFLQAKFRRQSAEHEPALDKPAVSLTAVHQVRIDAPFC